METQSPYFPPNAKVEDKAKARGWSRRAGKIVFWILTFPLGVILFVTVIAILDRTRAIHEFQSVSCGGNFERGEGFCHFQTVGWRLFGVQTGPQVGWYFIGLIFVLSILSSAKLIWRIAVGCSLEP
jgi:hypothetical protein